MPNKRPTKSVAAVTIATVIALSAWFIQPWEGTKPTGYADIVGVATACTGHTGAGVVVGKTYTEDQCDDWFSGDIEEAARAVDRCVWVPLTDYQWAAMTSLTFNIGPRTFCRSSIASKANKGDMAGACKAFDLYIYAGGKQVRGLIRRRAAERRLCEGRAT